MLDGNNKYRLSLLGTFRLVDPQGRRINIASKRSQALIAMVMTSRDGERTRAWLQDRLWGSRQRAQAQSSLRRELSNLRDVVNGADCPWLNADHNRVWIDMDRTIVDIDDPAAEGEFLEGLDIAGEEAFEDWLREQRRRIEAGQERDATGQYRIPSRIVDISQPVPGFSDRPTLAVLPLNNLTGQAEADFLADGLSEELIERLSRLKWLPVIARSASFLYRDQVIDLSEIGRSLGARYVIEGSLRLARDGYRVGLRIADVDTGLNSWSHSFDMPADIPQSTLDELIIEVVASLDMHIDGVETSLARRSTDLGSLNRLIWRGRWHLNRWDRKEGALAQQCFADALAIDPNSAEALVQMAYYHARSIWADRQDVARMRELRAWAQRAIEADATDGRGHMFAGMAELWMRNGTAALQLFRRAVQLNPSLALAHGQIGSALILANQSEQAMDPLRKALRLAPNDEHCFLILGEMAMAQFMLGRWDEAVDYAEQSLLRRVGYWYAHVIKVNALARQGKMQEAGHALRHLYEVKPQFRDDFVDWLPFADRQWNAVLKSGLQMAAQS